MKNWMRPFSTLLCGILCLGSAWTTEAQEALAEQFDFDAEINACIDRVLPRKSLSQRVVVRVFEQDVVVSESKADLYWRRFSGEGSRAVIRFIEPRERSGLALLAIEPPEIGAEPEMVMYVPELRATRRIGGSALASSMFGTNLSYEDFAQLQGLTKGQRRQRLADAELDGRENYVIEIVPGDPQSNYQRTRTYIDKQWCIPTSVRFYGNEEQLSKEFLIDLEAVNLINDRWVPHRMRLSDVAKGGYTEFIVESVEVDPVLKSLMFTRSGLERGR